MPSIVVTLVGPDRPGLVGAVSDVIRTHEGNWLESRLSHLAGQFAGMILVDVGAEHCASLISALQGLADQGLKVIAEVGGGQDVSDSPASLWTVEVVGNDRPGIVRELTQVLASHNVNVEELTTHCEDAPLGGGRIFRAQAQIRIPSGTDTDVLQDEAEQLAPELMIDFVPLEESPGSG